MEQPVTQQFPYLSSLNTVQREAVEHIEGPLLILAGAGTGKTRVLISRLAHILNLSRAWPSQVLAVTFTNKAAFEMKERLGNLLSNDVRGLWLGTFHSIGSRLLRRHAPLVGLSEQFTIIDTDDQLRILKQILELEGIDAKKQSAKYFAYFINLWKDRGLVPGKVMPDSLGYPKAEEALKIYKLYQERLRVVNAVDFGDLLLHMITIFQKHPDVLEQYQQQFKYILVDEYQDTNVAQYLLLRLLAQGHGNLCVVGDDDQSIYGWRGAEVGNILRFEKDFPGAKVVRLEQNYRSTPHILGAASGLIAHNKTRLGKTLWTEKDQGEPVRVKGLWDAREEARWIGETMEDWRRRDRSYKSMAVLVRAGFQTREFEEAFMSMAIPYRIIGGLRFYERQEIRDALAYLRLVVQPHDDLALERIINLPRRGIGKATLQKLHVVARETNQSLISVIHAMANTDELKGKTRASLLEFVQNIARWQSMMQKTSHEDLVKIILDESGYTGMWQKDKSIESTGRLENLKELVAAIAEFQDLPSFLEHVSLVMENAEARHDDSVTIMTMHSAKGLEYDIVFLAGWEEGVFPTQKTLSEGSKDDIEEERRLGYVGLTRARHQAYVTFASNRSIHGKWQSCIPSRFIQELPPDHVLILENAFIKTQRLGTAGYGPQPQKTIEINTGSKFQRNDRVFHMKFGYGTVRAVEQGRLTVDFDHTGEKKIMESFVELA